MMYSGVLRKPILAGETLSQAIPRIAHEAGALGYRGYEVLCGRCNHALSAHDLPGDCEVFINTDRILEKI